MGDYSAYYGHEVGDPSHNLPGPAQNIRHPGQVQVPGYPGGIWFGSQGPLPPPQVLVESSDGGAGGRVIRITFLWGERRGAGGPAVAQHLQCCGLRSGLPLEIPDGGRVLG